MQPKFGSIICQKTNQMDKKNQNQYSNKIVTVAKLKKIVGNRPRKKK